jgi:hypothetical protein
MPAPPRQRPSLRPPPEDAASLHGPVLRSEPLASLAEREGLTVAPVPVLAELEIVDGGRLPQRLRRKRS